MIHHLPPPSTIRSLADDMALVIHDYLTVLPVLATLYQTIDKASNLHLNTNKSHLIPTWPFTRRTVTQLIREQAPFWSLLNISQHATYAGFTLGPQGHILSWNSPITKYIQRINYIRSRPAGLTFAHLLHDTFAIPVLSYIASIYPLPDHLRNTIDKQIIRLTPAPHNWISPNLTALSSVVLPSVRPPLSPSRYTQAIHLNAVFSTFKHTEHHLTIHKALSNDDAYLYLPLTEWYANNPGTIIHRTRTTHTPLHKIHSLRPATAGD